MGSGHSDLRLQLWESEKYTRSIVGNAIAGQRMLESDMRKINGQYNWLGRKQSDLDVAMRAREADSAELKAKLDKVSEELEELKAKHEEMMSKFFERNTPAPSDRESGEDTEIEDAVDASYLLHNRFPATFTDATNSTPRIDSMSCSSFNTDYEGDDESEHMPRFESSSPVDGPSYEIDPVPRNTLGLLAPPCIGDKRKHTWDDELDDSHALKRIKVQALYSATSIDGGIIEDQAGLNAV